MARKSPEKEARTVTSGAGRAGSALGVRTLASSRAAAGTDAMRAGMSGFLGENDLRQSMKPALKGGFLYERIEIAKFNVDAAKNGLALRAEASASRTDPLKDIEVKDAAGRTVGEFQLKAGKSAHKELRDPKYSRVRKVTTKGGADPRHGIEDEVASRGARSGGTTERELRLATRHPRKYAVYQEMKQVGEETAVAGVGGALMGAALGGGIAAVTEFWAVAQGKKDNKEAAKAVVEGTVGSAARGGGAAAGGAIVRYVGAKAGMEALKKVNVATALASGLIDVGGTVWSLVKGDIAAEEAATRLGDTGCGALSGIYSGAAAGVVFGPAGAAVGSAVGYLLSACVYQACVETFQRTRLAEEQAVRAVALCAAAVKRMDEQRLQFQWYAAKHLEARQRAFDRHFRKFDAALARGDLKKSAKSLSSFALLFGKKLRHVDFEDFRRFMDSKEPLVL